MGEMKKGYGLEILCRNGKVVFIEHEEGFDIAYDEISSETLLAKLKMYVEGKRVQLWSDNDRDEPNTRVYVIHHRLEVYGQDEMAQLIEAIHENNGHLPIFEVNIEDNLV